MSTQSKKEVGGSDCPYRIQAGSYYDYLPWMECKKMPCTVSNNCQMCDIDAGEECRFAEKEKHNEPEL